MNNDGVVNTGDDAAFTLGLNDPAGYAVAFPGLDGSRVYHGDMNCDGNFDSGDQALFDAMQGSECCTTDCVSLDCPDEEF